ncbi:7 transmembrane receptor (Secretin family)-like protein 3 [Sarcoptes scabiei]|uniref:7 transmembrane receptor (Secretin family)-like protein 3 n=1 Tax=Sarcoptes scabiei TaxID=52283 RepID=A0A132AM42_SARSC|nr:7 transmembrane receptor (Secretin family)-like protein 3 [Sarcoptes scabiei]
MFLAYKLSPMIVSTEFPCLSNLKYDFIDIDRFTDNMCAQCLWFMAGNKTPWIDFNRVIRWRMLYNHSETINVLVCNPNCFEFRADYLNQPNNSIATEMKSPFYLVIAHRNLLLDCCSQARSCCEKILATRKSQNATLIEKSSSTNCPAKWDGFMCWDSARPQTINYQHCPLITYSALSVKPTSCRNEMANKECLSDGRWARIMKQNDENHLNESEEYTNYLPCSTPGATHRLRFIHVSIVLYSISLCLTIIGSLVLRFFPIKNQPRISEIHYNFLLSLILTAIFSLAVLIFIKRRHYNLETMIDKNPLWCRILMILKKTSRLTNYCWMLNEGVVLWQKVVRPMPINQINRAKFYLIGWLFPIVQMTIYSILHSSSEYNQSCWTKSMGYSELIYNFPAISFIIINFILLSYMIYVLFKKFTHHNVQHLRSSVKRSFVLVPVFGIHYVFYIVPFDPFESCQTFLFILHYSMIIIEALQGTIVTTIFCFFNSEIRSNIRKSFERKRLKHQHQHQHLQQQHSLNRRQSMDKIYENELIELKN